MQEQVKEPRTPWYKRKLIVNSNLQLVLLRYAISMGLLFLSLGMFLAFSFEKLLIVQMNGPESFDRNDKIIFSILFMLIIIISYMGLVVTNQIVGPIYRLVRHMEDSKATGQFKEIHFRKSDYFKEIAISYNQMLAHFHKVDCNPISVSSKTIKE